MDVAKIVAAVAAKVTELTIEIPEIVVIPTREVTFGFHDFDLTGLESIARQPISDEIMVQRLRDEARTLSCAARRGRARGAAGKLSGPPPHGHAGGRLRQPERASVQAGGPDGRSDCAPICRAMTKSRTSSSCMARISPASSSSR